MILIRDTSQRLFWLFSVKSHWALDAHFNGTCRNLANVSHQPGGLPMAPSAVENGCARRFWQNSQDWMIWITTKFGMLVYIYVYICIYTKCGFNQQKWGIYPTDGDLTSKNCEFLPGVRFPWNQAVDGGNDCLASKRASEGFGQSQWTVYWFLDLFNLLM